MEKTFTVSTANTDFRVSQRGDHPETVFLHGLGGDLSTWDTIWDLIGANLQAIRYDLRDFGQSVSHNSDPFSHGDDLAAILDTLGISRCNVVGVSLGGGVAINFALNYPHRVEKLVLISPALVAWEWTAAWKTRWREITAAARAGEMDKARELWWQHPLFATTRASPAAQNLHEAILRYSGKQWVVDNQRPELPDVERLYQLDLPVLLLTGQQDLEDFRLIAELVEACGKDVRRVDFTDLGHMLYQEDPAACAEEIRSFLAL